MPATVSRSMPSPLKDARAKERRHQAQDPPVPDPPTHPAHQGPVVDLVEAGADVAFEDPLVGVGTEEVDLSDRILGAAVRAEAVRARRKVRLEHRLQHEFERSLDHAVPDGRDAQPAALAAAFRDHPLQHRHRAERAGRKNGPQLSEEDLLAALDDGADGLTVYPGRARSPVGPDPTPCAEEGRRVTDEVVQVVEPTSRIVRRLSMQVGLVPLYPRRCLPGRRPRRAGIHRRPPTHPVPILRSRCRPCHVAGFPDLGLLRRLRPSTGPTADDGPAHCRPGRPDGRAA